MIAVKLIHDRDTGRSKGFKSVNSSSPQEAEVALQETDGRVRFISNHCLKFRGGLWIAGHSFECETGD